LGFLKEGAIFSGAIIPALLGGILFFTAFVSTIIFFTNICLCCCVNEKKMEEKRCKIFCGLLTFFVLGLVTTFSFTIYWMGQLNADVKQANCVLSMIPSDLLDGISGSEFEFMGMTNYLDLMNNFNDEAGKILTDDLSSNFDRIINKKPGEFIKEYDTSLLNFKNSNEGGLTRQEGGRRGGPEQRPDRHREPVQLHQPRHPEGARRPQLRRLAAEPGRHPGQGALPR